MEENNVDVLLDMLQETLIQIEYMHERFQETGSGNSVLTRGYALLQKIKENK